MTATVLTAQLFNNTSAAIFRGWGKAISDGIIAAGWVRTADTGQIDWTTVAAPTSANQIMGYEMFRAADSLQSSAPMFVKVQYGAAGSYVAQPQVYFQAGTATDGAGNLGSLAGLTGAVTTSRSIQASQGSSVFSSGTTAPIYITGDASSLVVIVAPSASAIPMFQGGGFHIERSRDPDGTITGRCVAVHWWLSDGTANSNTMIARSIYYNTGFAQPAEISGGGYTLAGGPLPTSIVEGNVLYPLPVLTGASPRLNGPSAWLVLAGVNDVPQGNSYSMTHYGISGTWLSAGIAASNTTAPTSSAYGGAQWTGVIGRLNSPQIRIA